MPPHVISKNGSAMRYSGKSVKNEIIWLFDRNTWLDTVYYFMIQIYSNCKKNQIKKILYSFHYRGTYYLKIELPSIQPIRRQNYEEVNKSFDKKMVDSWWLVRTHYYDFYQTRIAYYYKTFFISLYYRVLGFRSRRGLCYIRGLRRWVS
jgi:hypothetical protein